MFDLTGRPDITLRLAQAAWEVLPAPTIGVQPLDRSGVPMVRSASRRTDAVESWSWQAGRGARPSSKAERGRPGGTLRLESGEPVLRADGTGLAFLDVAITDSAGTTEMLTDEEVTVTVTGPAQLIGLGTANPAPLDAFTGDTCTTFRGRALTVLRATGEPGEVTVTAHSRSAGAVELRLPARNPNAPHEPVPAVLPH